MTWMLGIMKGSRQLNFLALRVLIATYLDNKLFSGVFLSCFDLDYEIDTDLIFLKGPQQDLSSQALSTNETVFATYY